MAKWMEFTVASSGRRHLVNLEKACEITEDKEGRAIVKMTPDDVFVSDSNYDEVADYIVPFETVREMTAADLGVGVVK